MDSTEAAECEAPVTRRPGRQLPAVPSKIPVRRDQSLPSSGRSTPGLATPGPGLQREASSPPGLLFTGGTQRPRPLLAPKPSLNIMQRSAPGPASPPVNSGAASKIPRPRNNGGLKKWDSTSALEVS